MSTEKTMESEPSLTPGLGGESPGPGEAGEELEGEGDEASVEGEEGADAMLWLRELIMYWQ